MRYFCGIGSRETPEEICSEMTKISEFLCQRGFTLRSGGAIGADQAFERGATNKEIFLPWKGYEGNDSPLTEPCEKAVWVSRKLFPHFPGVSVGTRKMISRNMHQVLGQEIGTSPKSEFVVCWTSNGKKKGGTAYAMKAAEYFGIPIFNLYNDEDRIKMWRYFEDYVVEREDLE